MRRLRIKTQKPAPFLRWVGGKGKLVEELTNLLPHHYSELRHVEPFVGGGAMFFALCPKRAWLTDANDDLMSTYRVVRDDLDDLVSALYELERERQHESFPAEHYYEVRKLYNEGREEQQYAWTSIDRAAMFIYLNKLCFNGVYRTNASGEYNVPIGDYRNPKIVDVQTLAAASKALKGIGLLTSAFEHTLAKCDSNDFVYLDPPYEPVGKNGFTTYQANGFDQNDQRRLKEAYDNATRKGIRMMMTNSDCELIRQLYKDYVIDEVQAPRSVNSKGSGRGLVTELVIRNYR